MAGYGVQHMVIRRLGVSTDLASSWRSRLLACAAVLGGLSGCADQKGPPFLVQVASSASGDICSADIKQLSTLSPKLVRLTVRQRSSATDKGAFLCDRVLKFPDQQPFLKLDGMQPGLDLWVEAFAPAATPDPKAGALNRIASGVLYNVARTATTGSTIRLLPSTSYSCAAGTMAQARAFHSATALPNGEVLVVGGAVAGVDPARVELDSFQLYATGLIEVYDPITSKMVAVTDSASTQRAFHQAVLINDTAPYQILVVGGVSNGTDPIVKLGTSDGEGTRFYPRQDVFTLFATKAVAAEILTYDPTTHSVTHTPMASIPTAALQAIAARAGNVVIAGGINFTTNPNAPIDATHAKDLVNSSPAGIGMLASDTAGGALALLSGNQAIIYGGGRLGVPGGGQLLSGIGTATPTAVGFAGGSKSVRFPTLSLISSTSATATLLTTGGFEVLADGSATQPLVSAGSAQLITVTGNTAAAAAAPIGSPTDCASATRYRAAGWEAASTLPGGRVVISGGSPSTLECGGNCESGQTGNLALTCALHQSAIFDNGTLTLGNPMGVARSGHVLTTLRDGTILVTGGLQSTTSVAKMVREIEIFNPRRVIPPWDMTKPSSGDADDPVSDELLAASFTRAPGEVAKRADGTAAAECKDL